MMQHILLTCSLHNCSLHIEFAYNRYFHSTTSFSPFEVVYGFNPLTSIDILPLPTNKHANLDGKRKANFCKGFICQGLG